MITHEQASGMLDAYVDGELDPAAVRRLEAHLILCTDCRTALSSLGLLLDGAARLRTRKCQPARDLWPDLARRLGQAGSADEGRRSRHDAGGGIPANADPDPKRTTERGGSLTWWDRIRRALLPTRPRDIIWGVAVLGLVVALYSARVWQQQPDVGSLGQVEGLSTVASEADRARADLDAAIQGRDGAWPADAGADFQQSLRMLDQAIKDSRAALEANPLDQSRQRSLLMIYQKQLDLLRWATRLVQQT